MEKIWHKSWPEYLPKELKYPHGEKPVFEYLRFNANKFPESKAIIYYGKTISYRELDESSDRFANYLISKGLGKGDRVGIFMGNCPQYIIAIYGVQKMGGVVCPISPMFKEMELRYQVNDAELACLVTLDIYMPIVNNIKNEIPTVKNIVVTNYNDYLPAEPVMPVEDYMKITRQPQAFQGVDDFLDILKTADPTPPTVDIDLDNDIAILEYTGGTTGLPKGAMLTHRANLFKPTAMAQVRELNENSIEITCMPFFNIAGMTCMVGIVIYGATNVLLTQFDPLAALIAADRYKATTMYTAVPGYVQMINHPDARNYDLSSFKIALCTSFVISLNEKIAQQWSELAGGSILVEAAYGLSETHTADTFMPRHKVKYGSVGIPTFETDIKILDLDDKTREVPIGEQGEIAVKNPGCMKGYWKNEAATKETLVDGYVHTGDIGKFDEDGYLWWLGRLKEMIKVSGFSVFPEEVESLLNQHPDIAESAVIPVPDDRKGEVVKAFIVLKPERKGQVEPEEIIKWARSNMTPHKVPVYVEFRDELPKSGVKTLRRLLRDEEQAR
ncbi:MAG TPA: AMP-binding protein [Bacillota bacterium]|nr:AMP-binding protein [Bacillota bacterium]